MKLRLTIDGKAYEVDVEIVEDDRPRLGQSQPAAQLTPVAPVGGGPTGRPAAAPDRSTNVSGPEDESKAFRSPISGVVVRVPVQVGQGVKKNEVLMVLEAMKMETVITSQYEGKIARINAGVGDSVQVRQVLVEFE